MLKFRPNVAALVVDLEGKLLVCERLRIPGAWQFPQGGIDAGEAPEQALIRELEEEIGLKSAHYEILASKGGYRYVFPEDIGGKKTWKYRGQEQTYFLVRLKGPCPELKLKGKGAEFRSAKWISASEFKATWLPEFKREVYAQVLRDFFQVELSPT